MENNWQWKHGGEKTLVRFATIQMAHSIWTYNIIIVINLAQH